MPETRNMHPTQPVAGSIDPLRLQQLCAEGLALFQRSELAQAERVFKEILAVQPRHFDALHLLGIIAARNDEHRRAVDLLDQAIEIDARNAACHSNRGNILLKLGLLDAAIASYDRAIALTPDYADACYNRGVALHQARLPLAALASYERAIAIDPRHANAHGNCGNVLLELRRWEDALASYDRAIALDSARAELYHGRGIALQELRRNEAAAASYDRALTLAPALADAWFNRGNALQELRQFENAVASYDRAIALRRDFVGALYNRGNALLALKQLPAALDSYERVLTLDQNHAQAHSNRGNALLALGQLEAAIASYERAAALKPDLADAWSNRGVALLGLGRPEAALQSYDRAIAVNPQYADAHYNRGIALQTLKHPEAAVLSFERAIALRPDYAPAWWNKALTLLQNGNFVAGLPLYEWRWKLDAFKSAQRLFPQPLWLGNFSVQRKTVLLHSEQGLGDTLQFCRYAPLVAAQGARVILQVPASLVAVMQGLEGVTAVIAEDAAPPAFDCHCPLLSLPLAFRTHPDSIPHATPYLRADAERLRTWTQKLGSRTRPRVGLVWSGNRAHPNDAHRSVPLPELMQALPDGFDYVSLQKDTNERDLITLQGDLRLRHFGDELQDFADTAALCCLMDLVISVDTSVAHLSGALARPTWIMLPFNADWRWLLNREDSPWYPGTRLMRQRRAGDWPGVMQRIGVDLHQNFGASGNARAAQHAALSSGHAEFPEEQGHDHGTRE